MKSTKSVVLPNGSKRVGESSAVVQLVDANTVDIDYSWNGRSIFEADSTVQEGKKAGDGKRGWMGVCLDIARSKLQGKGHGGTGIKEALICRPNPKLGKTINGVKHTKPLSLVCGFTRAKSATEVAAGEHTAELLDPNQGAMTPKDVASLKTDKVLLPVIVENMTEEEAVRRNMGENLLRNDMTAQDIAYGVIRLKRLNPSLTDAAIATAFGKNPTYVGRITSIQQGLEGVMLPEGWEGKDSKSVPLLDAWRSDRLRPSVWDMLEISKAEGDKSVAYLKATNRKVPGESNGETETPSFTPQRGWDKWVPNTIGEYLPKIADMLVSLQRLDFLELHGEPTREVLTALLVGCGRPLPKPTKSYAGLTENDFDKLAGAMRVALIEAGKRARAKAQEEGAAAAASASEAPPAPKGKGKKANGKAAHA